MRDGSKVHLFSRLLYANPFVEMVPLKFPSFSYGSSLRESLTPAMTSATISFRRTAKQDSCTVVSLDEFRNHVPNTRKTNNI